MPNTQVTLSELRGPLNELNINLAGENGREWLNGLNEFLRKDSWRIHPRWANNIWITTTVGNKRPLRVLVDRIKKRGIEISYSDSVPFDMLSVEEQIEFNHRREKIHFVVASPRDLGLTPGRWTQQQLLDAAPVNGLTPCLPGDILEILTDGKFDLQKMNDSMHIAMQPVMVRNPVMFAIGKYEDVGYHLGYLNGDLQQVYTYPGNVDNKYLFRARKIYTYD